MKANKLASKATIIVAIGPTAKVVIGFLKYLFAQYREATTR